TFIYRDGVLIYVYTNPDNNGGVNDGIGMAEVEGAGYGGGVLWDNVTIKAVTKMVFDGDSNTTGNFTEHAGDNTYGFAAQLTDSLNHEYKVFANFAYGGKQANNITADMRTDYPGVVDSTVILSILIGDRKSTRLNSSHVAISYAV